MTTFTAWKFDTPDGADEASSILNDAAREGLVKVVDSAVVSWPADRKQPHTHHRNEDKLRGTGWGAFFGFVFGTLFFAPFLGAALGAAAGVTYKSMEAIGLNKDQVDHLRAQVVPGTSGLFVVTSDANNDRLGERFNGLEAKLVESNLSDAEDRALQETFGE